MAHAVEWVNGLGGGTLEDTHPLRQKEGGATPCTLGGGGTLHTSTAALAADGALVEVADRTLADTDVVKDYHWSGTFQTDCVFSVFCLLTSQTSRLTFLTVSISILVMSVTAGSQLTAPPVSECRTIQA